MRFLLLPIGSSGDVHPYVGLGRTLKARGHEVTVATNPHFEPLVRGAGLNFAPIGTAEGFEVFLDNPDLWHRTKSWKVALRWGALDSLRQMYDVVAEFYRPGETVVAGSCMAFGARIAQEKLGVPYASIHLEPDKFRSLHRTPIMQPPMMLQDWVPKISKRTQLWIADRLVVDRFVGPPTNSFRRELSLPPVRRLIADWWHSPQRVIGLFPRWYCPPQSDWPPQSVLTGFPIWDRSETTQPPHELSQWLEKHERPIVFTPGTGNRHAIRFFQAAVEACHRLGRPGILLTPYRYQAPATLPSSVMCAPYVPFRYLLPRAAALVHHAGIGTTAQGLMAGIPQVVMPMTFSQPDDASRLVRHGVAASLSPRRFRGARLARLLNSLLNSPEVARRCRALADRIDGEQPLVQTSDLLEQLIGSDVGVTEGMASEANERAAYCTG
ncbi:MAG: nucleotide disphospho-sugar-binding domain-containing protein [Pirellulales bacterium]